MNRSGSYSASTVLSDDTVLRPRTELPPQIQEKCISTNTSFVQEAPDSDEKAKRHDKMWIKVITLLALQGAFFLSTLDNTIISTCLTHIGSDFDEFTLISWVADSYLLTLAAFQPLFSKFNDIFGRKWSLTTAVCFFLVGSLLCGISTSMVMLILCRAITGIGAAGILSAVTVIVYEMAPVEKRGVYQGIISSVYAVAGILGPLIGGAFSDNGSWRWVFYINLPIGGVSLILLLFLLDLPTPKTSFTEKLKRIDYAGGESNAWGSVSVIALIVLSAVLLAVFVVIECKHATDPVLPPHLFRNQSVLAITFLNWILGINYFVTIYFLPIYLQVVKGDTALWSGIHVFIQQVGVAFAAISTGYVIAATGFYRPFIWMGMLFITIGVGLFCLLKTDTPLSEFYGITLLSGFGSGLLFSSTIISLISSVEGEDLSIVSGLGDFSRLIGGSVGIAIANTILNSCLTNLLPSVLPPEYIQPVIKSTLFIHDGLPKQYQAATLKVYADSLGVIWYAVTPLTVLGLIASGFVQSYSITRPGQSNSKQASLDLETEVVNIRPLEH
ncbi:hypothetical protein [Absidia glauca]|uniref:Major facilitator superfamily (MFS) profile domain-containing protein n=1 Tax=Absidia glauca TaxID=4829 RepID=A0A168RMW8_ABSGL|nr:hypothetical protein [Absidia glauca]